jgi:nucleoside-diphosphate-sugar epimerase
MIMRLRIEAMANEKTLVTGAKGFIGRRMVELLQLAGQETVVLTRQDCNLQDLDAVKNAMLQFKPSRIIHLAAQPVGDEHQLWSEASLDFLMLSNIVKSMPTHCRLVHAGSMAEFGKSGIHTEFAICTPRSAYGFAKSCATNFALASRLNNSLDIRVGRLFGVFGEGENANRLFPFLVARLLLDQTVLLSDGQQIRDFIHVDDVCRVIIELSERPSVIQPILNVGTGEGMKVRDVCEIVANMVGEKSYLLKFGELPRRAIDEDELVANTDLLANFTTVPPQHWKRKNSVAMNYIEQLKLGLPKRR